MRLLTLTRYGRLGASSRLRSLQYLPFFEARGASVHWAPLFPDAYVAGLYDGRRSWGTVAQAYCNRVLRLVKADCYDVLWIQKELLPWAPAWLEKCLLPRDPKLVLDYDDAVFHKYDCHRLSLVRAALRHKIDRIMRRADLVIAGNDYLASRARAAGCQRVEWLPTVVDLARYPVREREKNGNPVTIGWIGSPATAQYLQLVREPLAALKKQHGIRCVAIGARPDQVIGTPFEVRPWTEDSEVEELYRFDIGIMPLGDEPWERGKCGYKLIQYMAVALPVVASPVGVNSQIVQEGVNGFLPGTAEKWHEYLQRLILDPALRATLGLAGRRTVEETYSLQVQAPLLWGMLRSLVEK